MKILLVISLLITSIYAVDSQEVYERVLITKTSTKSKLPLIKKELDKLRVKMFVQTIPSGHYVYSEIFTSKRLSQYNLRKVKTRFPNAKLVKIDTKKNTNIANEDNKDQNIQNKNSNSYFIRLGIANASVSGSTNVEAASGIDNSSLGFSFEPGYIYSENLFFSAAYMDNSTDDISFSNLYTSANYKYNIINNFGLYTGVLLGYSTLELTGYELSSESTSLLYGFQLGIDYNLLGYIQLFGTYQMFMLDHTINMVDTNSKMKFDSMDNFMVGVGYEF